VKQAHTDMEALNTHEHAYLATYVEEQSQLRTSAAALLEKGRPMREEHARLLEEQRLALVVLQERHTRLFEEQRLALVVLQEEQRRRLEEVEGPLRVVNDELEEALAKMYALKKENQVELDSLRGRHESMLAAYTAAYSPATLPLTPDEYAQVLYYETLSY
jgi:hypothetical protein